MWKIDRQKYVPKNLNNTVSQKSRPRNFCPVFVKYWPFLVDLSVSEAAALYDQ